jgi:predicted acyl esterase
MRGAARAGTWCVALAALAAAARGAQVDEVRLRGAAERLGAADVSGAAEALSLDSTPRAVELGSLHDLLHLSVSHARSEYEHAHAMFGLFAKFERLIDGAFADLASGEASNLDWASQRRYVSHHRVAMRDGVELSTIVIRPTLAAGDRRGALLSRSPYGPTSDQVASLFMVTNGLVAVIQDQRGTFASGGKFSMWQHDGADGTDTMQWIAAQEWSDGEVFAAGVSADGCGALTQIIEAPPQLKGQFLMLASANAHETIYPGGAFRVGLVAGWMTAMSVFTGGHSLTRTLPEIIAHEALSPWYSTVEIDDYIHQVSWPTVHLTAWWDIFAGLQLRAFDLLAAKSQPTVRRQHAIFVGPYGHCELGNLFRPKVTLQEGRAWINSFGFASELFAGRMGKYRARAKRVNFFVQGLYEEDGLTQPDAGNFWASADDWPRQTPVRMLLSKDHALKEKGGLFGAAHTEVQAGDDEYTYRPRNPVETYGGNNLIIMLEGHSCGPQDQAANEKRNDVVVFTTPAPLETPLAITGSISAELYVSSNRNDTDFTVTLTDVYPDGKHYKSMLVRYGIQRMKWRDGPRVEAPPMRADEIYKIAIDLWPTSYVFNAGHRIRVAVSSSNSPYFLKNDDEGDLVDEESPLKGEPARNTIHFSNEMPSALILPVVDLDDLHASRNDAL